MPKIINLVGQTFGELTVLRKISLVGAKESEWLCLCSCGTETTATTSWLRRKYYPKVDCGCKPYPQVVHGGSRTKLYRVWMGMKERCYYEKHKSYHLYKDRGVDYEPWITDFSVFRDWALVNGYREGLELDRKNNSKGYSPDNCHFVTRAQNARNKSTNVVLTAFGETKILEDWINDPRTQVTRKVLRRRLSEQKFSVQDALTVPLEQEVRCA